MVEPSSELAAMGRVLSRRAKDPRGRAPRYEGAQVGIRSSVTNCELNLVISQKRKSSSCDQGPQKRKRIVPALQRLCGDQVLVAHLRAGLRVLCHVASLLCPRADPEVRPTGTGMGGGNKGQVVRVGRSSLQRKKRKNHQKMNI